MQTLLRKSLIVSGIALGAGVVGAIAATSARSLLLPETTSLVVPAKHGATNEPNSTYYYFPSQFPTPEGSVAEPIGTF